MKNLYIILLLTFGLGQDYSLSFDGVNDYVELDTTNLNTSTDFTIQLDVIDYVILACIKNGVKKYTNIFKNCKKTNAGKFREHVNELEDMNLVTIDSSESWFTRNTNPSIILKKDGIKFVEENTSKVQEHWNQKCD